jgi:hypothetical protein
LHYTCTVGVRCSEVKISLVFVPLQSPNKLEYPFANLKNAILKTMQLSSRCTAYVVEIELVISTKIACVATGQLYCAY